MYHFPFLFATKHFYLLYILREEKLDRNAKNRKKIASDFVNGTFGKKLGIKTDENGMASAKLADYLGTLEKQKTAAADQPSVQ